MQLPVNEIILLCGMARRLLQPPHIVHRVNALLGRHRASLSLRLGKRSIPQRRRSPAKPQYLGGEPRVSCDKIATSLPPARKRPRPMPAAKKLIEVALPLDAINQASAREKSIRHGHPSTLHLWWARRPLAAARAVIFTSLVDDPDDKDALPAFVAACKALPGNGPNVQAKGDSPRMRLFDFIERLVTWEATTDDNIMGQARELIRIATEGKPPPLLDPFAGRRQHPARSPAPWPRSPRQRPQPRRRDDQQSHDRDSAALRQQAASEPQRPRGLVSPHPKPLPP